MAKITFYNLGNADSILTEFSDGRLFLKDYFCPDPQTREEDDKRAILSDELNEILDEKDRNYIDVVCFSHRDKDHVEGAEKYFKMEHSPNNKEYGEVEIKELWVPSYFIIETNLECESARIIQKEARHRLREGKNIKVLGSSEDLLNWISKNVKENRDGCIVKAGKCLDRFVNKTNGNAEIFLHSPFSAETDGDDSNPNEASVVLHITFFEDDSETKVMLGADITSKVWDKLIQITEDKGNQHRLEWDIFKISHHCSYKALNQDEKGKDKTEPTSKIKELFEKGDSNSYLVSSSDPVPLDDTDQPPHKQAKAYYRSLSGTFIVTMEEPSKVKPKPQVFKITNFGHSWSKVSGIATGIGAIPSQKSQRQGDE